METISVFEFGKEFVCKAFYNIDFEGVEIFKEEERLGSIVGLSIPNIADTKEIQKFSNQVIEWVVDNNY